MIINFLAEYDLAGAEWVIVAHLTGDERMLEVVESGQSPHPATAHFMTGLPVETIIAEDKAVGKTTNPADVALARADSNLDLSPAAFLPISMSLRQAGKKANHALNYGMGPYAFADQNQISVKEARKMRELYIRAYPGIAKWWQQTEFKVRKTRFLETCYGRRIRFQGPLFGSGGNATMREAYSAIPQSTCVEITNYGMARVNGEMPTVLLKSQNHDSITVQHYFDPKRLDEEAKRISLEIARIKRAMSTPAIYNNREFVLEVDCKAGLNWADQDKKTNPQGMRDLVFEIETVKQFLREIS